MTLQTEGVGYDDLNTLLKNPSNLIFTIGNILFLIYVNYFLIKCVVNFKNWLKWNNLMNMKKNPGRWMKMKN